MAETYLFLYGTLKSGQSNNHRLAGQRLVGPAVTLPLYKMMSLGWHPGMVHVGAGGSAIRGEIWAVDEATLAALDEFEGVPDLFVRQPVALANVTLDVHAYHYNGPIPESPITGTEWPFPA